MPIKTTSFSINLFEYRGGYHRGSLVALWLLQPHINQETGIIHRTPTDE